MTIPLVRWGGLSASVPTLGSPASAQQGPRSARPGPLVPGHTLFFVLLLSLITLLENRFRPVYEIRFSPDGPPAGTQAAGPRCEGLRNGERDAACGPERCELSVGCQAAAEA